MYYGQPFERVLGLSFLLTEMLQRSSLNLPSPRDSNGISELVQICVINRIFSYSYYLWYSLFYLTKSSIIDSSEIPLLSLPFSPSSEWSYALPPARAPHTMLASLWSVSRILSSDWLMVLWVRASRRHHQHNLPPTTAVTSQREHFRGYF